MRYCEVETVSACDKQRKQQKEKKKERERERKRIESGELEKCKQTKTQ